MDVVKYTADTDYDEEPNENIPPFVIDGNANANLTAAVVCASISWASISGKFSWPCCSDEFHLQVFSLRHLHA